MPKWNEDGSWRKPANDREAYRRGMSSTAKWGIGIVLVCVLISGVFWGASVLFSDAAGRGNAIRAKNDAVNRIGKQELFEELWADIKAYDRQIGEAQTSLDADPSSTHWQTVRTGLVNQCIDASAQYDAEARKYTARDFRAVDLPPQIDTLDPATDCAA